MEGQIKIDLGFIIDSSSSIEPSGAAHFQIVKNFVKELTRALHVSKEGHHVGVLIYSSNAHVVFGFNQHYEQAGIFAAVDAMKYVGGETMTGLALTLAQTELFGKGARATARKLLVVLTGGMSRDSVAEPALKVRGTGVTVISVGIGLNYDIQQLNAMATDPDKNHVFTADFSTLISIIQTIRIRFFTG